MEDKVKRKITLEDISDVVYYTSLRSNSRSLDKHFRGILPFFLEIQEDNEKILEELDYIKLAIQQLSEKPKRTRKKKEDVTE